MGSCGCNGGNDMRADRVIPPGGDPTAGGLPIYGAGGFSNVLIGNPRADPSSGLPTIKVQGILEGTKPSAATPGSPGASAAAPGLAGSSSTTPIVDAAKEHWPWILVAALVAAALWVK
jgi:hypothetical protein